MSYMGEMVLSLEVWGYTWDVDIFCLGFERFAVSGLNFAPLR